MDRIILLFCSFISCVILVNLLFQFFNDRYLRAYNSKLLYILLPIVSIIIVTPINMFMSPILNMLVNVIWIGFAQCHLDKDDAKNSVCRNMYPVLFLYNFIKHLTG